MKNCISLICAIFLLNSFNSFANISFSGFGSIVAGKTMGTVDDPLNPGQTRDEILTADFYDVGQYTNDITFKAESLFAIQSRVEISPELSVTGQLVAKGTDDFEAEFDWYYLTYNLSDSTTLMAGRRNIPMYYFSEFSEVGYAYPWIRPPSNLYWWQITQFNGVHLSHSFDMGNYFNTITVFYGNEYHYDNKEMLYYDKLYGGSATSVDEIWTNIVGFNWNFVGDNFDLRFVYFQNDRDRDTNFADGSVTSTTPFSQQFAGLGGTVNWEQFTFLFDWNYVTYDDALGTIFPTYLISVVYNFDEYQPYISYSKADHEREDASPPTEDLEEHYMLSYGVRYNFTGSASLKIQYDIFRDQGHEATGWAYHGDSDTIAIAIDFVF